MPLLLLHISTLFARPDEIPGRSTPPHTHDLKDYLCDIVEVIDDTKFDESIWIRVPGERGKRSIFVGNIYVPPESKSRVSDIQRRFGEIAEGVQKYKKQGEVMLVVDVNARVGKASRPDDIIG